MILISLLMALLLERVTVKTQYWRSSFYANQYAQWLESRGWFDDELDLLRLLLMVALPCLLLYLILGWLGDGVIGFVVNTAILYICLGCPQLRSIYKRYLQAAERGDLRACEMYADELGHISHDQDQGESFGQHLVWLNYTHYVAVIIAFIAFGGAGAVLYVLSYRVCLYVEERQSDEYSTEQRHQLAQQFMFALDFIPVRITAFGFLLVGHFGRALPIWLGHVVDLTVSAKTLLCDVTEAAEDTADIELEESEQKANPSLSEPQILVKLAKRNIIFLLVVVSILTVTGVIT